MQLLDAVQSNPLRKVEPESFVCLADVDAPGVLEIRKASIMDRYDVRPGALCGLGAVGSFATSVLAPLYGGGVAFPREPVTWDIWLPEIDARVVLPRRGPGSTVGRQLEGIQRVTGLSDQQLAAAFPGGVTRETVNRWRNRPDPNLRPENLYRLGVLHELAERIEAAGIDAPVWLHQPALGDDTPYALICSGRLGDVRRTVEGIAAGAIAPTDSSVAVASREWDTVVDGDDDAEWVWDEDGDG